MFVQKCLTLITGTAIALGIVLGLPSKTSAKDFDEIYVFGDSYSDTGNAFKSIENLPSQSKLFFEELNPNRLYFQRRYSNGFLWEEYLAAKLGLPENSINNFAVAGATTGSNNAFNGLDPYKQINLSGLQQQIENFANANPSADPDALYTIWVGTNDYLIGATDPTTTIENLSTAITSLVSLGAENILVPNLLDYGKFPITVDSSNSIFPSSIDSSISRGFSTVFREHNSELVKNLDNLSQRLGSDVNLIQLDVSSLFDEIIANPEKFNFTNVTSACVAKVFDVCAQPDEFLFHDNIHLSTAAHHLVANLAFSALAPMSTNEPVTKIPEPNSAWVVLVLSALSAGLYCAKTIKARSFDPVEAISDAFHDQKHCFQPQKEPN
jgi:phospholipase/lecithinase/hemolysin